MRLLLPFLAFFAKCHGQDSVTSTVNNSDELYAVLLARGNGTYHGHRPNIIPIVHTAVEEFILLPDGTTIQNPAAGWLSGWVSLAFPLLVSHLVSETSQQSYEETLDPLNLVLTGQIQMSSLLCQPDSCSDSDLQPNCTGCVASFCMTNIDLVARHPHRYPMYMEVTDTEHCLKQEKKFDLDYIYHEALV